MTPTRALALISVAVLLSASAFAQSAPAPFPDQIVGATLQYDQASSTPVTGSVFYSKLVDANLGAYSFTRIVETSVKTKPFNVQTQTETGACLYTMTVSAFKVFGCGSGGLSAAGGATGLSGSGTVLITKPLKRGWLVGITGGPSYSGVLGKVTYPVGLVVGWGK